MRRTNDVPGGCRAQLHLLLTRNVSLLATLFVALHALSFIFYCGAISAVDLSPTLTLTSTTSRA